tara:strand:+ start:854 stop:1339 length:486 start_codon:yes stop_codon:yes gene_type:complete
MIVDLFLVYNMVKRLATPFNEWEAYKLGIIDERGNLLKSRKDLRTIKERNAFGLYDLMILKLKRLVEKVPGGKTRLGSYAAALYLVKEGKLYNEETPDKILEEGFMKHYTTLSEDDINLRFEEIVNTAGGGNVAGLPPDDPVVSKKSQKKLLKRKELQGVK